MEEESNIGETGLVSTREGESLFIDYAKGLEDMARILINFKNVCREEFLLIHKMVELLTIESNELSQQVEGYELNNSEVVQFFLEYINNLMPNKPVLISVLERREEVVKSIDSFQSRCREFCLEEGCEIDPTSLLGESTKKVLSMDLSEGFLFASDSPE